MFGSAIVGALAISFLTMSVTLRLRRIEAVFRKAGATSELSAKPLDELEIRESRLRRKLSSKGVLRKSDAESYYLDESAVAQVRRRGRTMASVAISSAIAVVMTVWMTTQAG